jgi:hypothetical protein
LKDGEGKLMIETNGGESTGGQGSCRAVVPSDDDDDDDDDDDELAEKAEKKVPFFIPEINSWILLNTSRINKVDRWGLFR